MDGDSESETVSSLPPRMQANFLCAFSLGYTLTYSGATYFADRENLPGWPYFVTLLVVYLVFWAPFYLQSLFALPQVARRLMDRLGDLLSQTSLPTAIPPTDQGTLLAPKQASRPAESRWPLSESIRVQCLAMSVIVMTAWYCTYSGGPFQSPYGQILLALPLLSPNIAAKSSSIAGVYVASALSAILFQFAFSSSSTPPTMSWYVLTTLGILAISAYVSWITRRRQEQSVSARLKPHSDHRGDTDEPARQDP